MTRNIIALIGLALLVGCSSGGGDDAPPSSPSANTPTPSSPTEFLVATPAGLWRGQANGQGGVVLAKPNLQRETVLLSEGLVVYSRGVVPKEDIWTVRADGTGDRALLNAPERELLKAFSAPWLIYTLPDTQNTESRSLRLDTQAQFVMNDTGYLAEFVFFQNKQRVMVIEDYAMSSKTPTGTGSVVYVSPTVQPLPADANLAGLWIVEDVSVYRVHTNGSNFFSSHLFAIPLAGGQTVQLDDEQTNADTAIPSGRRMVYEHCSAVGVPICDISSVNLDGTGKVTLANHSANEALQGVTTSQAIIRRNFAGNDQLIAVPITGGPERPLTTLTDNEFVDTIVGDLIILRRPSGTWSLDLNGNLTRLGSTPGLDMFAVVGDRICSDIGEVKCMPLNGSGPEVRIATNAKIVGVL